MRCTTQNLLTSGDVRSWGASCTCCTTMRPSGARSTRCTHAGRCGGAVSAPVVAPTAGGLSCLTSSGMQDSNQLPEAAAAALVLPLAALPCDGGDASASSSWGRATNAVAVAAAAAATTTDSPRIWLLVGCVLVLSASEGGVQRHWARLHRCLSRATCRAARASSHATTQITLSSHSPLSR
jgi:hypothetical protein